MAADRRKLLLGGGVIVAVIVAAIVWTSSGSETSALAPRTAPRAQVAGKSDQADQAPAQVELERLKMPRGQPVDSERNPFRFRPRPAPTPPRTSLPTPASAGNGSSTVSALPPVPSGPPQPPSIPLKFIGIVTQGNARVAVLTDGKGTPLSGKEGTIILGQYQILKIGNESIEMAYVDGRGRQTIRLTGQ